MVVKDGANISPAGSCMKGRIVLIHVFILTDNRNATTKITYHGIEYINLLNFYNLKEYLSIAPL